MQDKRFIGNLLDEALSTGGDFAEIYVEDTESTGLTMLGGKVYKASAGRDYGVGIRIFNGYNAIYAYTCGNDKEEIAKTVKKAAQAVKKDSLTRRNELKSETVDNIHIIQIPPNQVEKSRKVQLMSAAHAAAKSVDPLISQVSINYSDSSKHILVANSTGKFVEDHRTYTRMYISAVASKGDEMQTGGEGPGAAGGGPGTGTARAGAATTGTSRSKATRSSGRGCLRDVRSRSDEIAGKTLTALHE